MGEAVRRGLGPVFRICSVVRGGCRPDAFPRRSDRARGRGDCGVGVAESSPVSDFFSLEAYPRSRCGVKRDMQRQFRVTRRSIEIGRGRQVVRRLVWRSSASPGVARSRMLRSGVARGHRSRRCAGSIRRTCRSSRQCRNCWSVSVSSGSVLFLLTMALVVRAGVQAHALGAVAGLICYLIGITLFNVAEAKESMLLLGGSLIFAARRPSVGEPPDAPESVGAEDSQTRRSRESAEAAARGR